MAKYNVLYDEYENKSLARIHLTCEEYGGIIYHYTTVYPPALPEDDSSEETATLRFEYEIDEVPADFDLAALTPEDKVKFENNLGDILVELITEAFEREDRADNTDKSDL